MNMTGAWESREERVFENFTHVVTLFVTFRRRLPGTMSLRDKGKSRKDICETRGKLRDTNSDGVSPYGYATATPATDARGSGQK